MKQLPLVGAAPSPLTQRRRWRRRRAGELTRSSNHVSPGYHLAHRFLSPPSPLSSFPPSQSPLLSSIVHRLQRPFIPLPAFAMFRAAQSNPFDEVVGACTLRR